MLHGLRRCVELGFLNVIAESDSKSLVQMLVTNAIREVAQQRMKDKGGSTLPKTQR